MARSKRITLITLIILLNCLWSLKLLLNAQWYWYIFQYLPASEIECRYVISLTERILLIAACAGMWQTKEWGRRLAMILMAANILALPWKHPSLTIGYSFNYYHVSGQLVDLLPLSVAVLTAWDFLFNGVLIFLLAQKNIRSQFKPHRS